MTVTSFECTTFVFKIPNENNSFSVFVQGQYNSNAAEKAIDELNKLLELRSQNDIEKQVIEVRKRANQLRKGDNEYKLSVLDTQKKEILEEIKNVKYNGLEDLVYRMQLTYDETTGNLKLKYIPRKRTGHSLNPAIYKIIDLNNTLEHTLPDNVKVSGTIDDIRLKTNSKKFIRSLIFTGKSFFIQI